MAKDDAMRDDTTRQNDADMPLGFDDDRTRGDNMREITETDFDSPDDQAAM